MSQFTKLQNQFIDEYLTILSGNSIKCYLFILRKTIGWNKEKDSISISQFMKNTGIKRAETITKSINELIGNKLIDVERVKGKVTKYTLINRNGKTVVPLKNSTTKKPCHPPLKNRATSTTKKPCTTKDTIKDTNIKDIQKSKPKKRFKKPTHENIKNYLEEKQQQMDIGYFIDYYESKDWMIGKNRMKNWKSAVNNWLRNNKKFEKVNNGHNQKSNRKLTPYEQLQIDRQADFDFIAKHDSKVMADDERILPDDLGKIF